MIKQSTPNSVTVQQELESQLQKFLNELLLIDLKLLIAENDNELLSELRRLDFEIPDDVVLTPELADYIKREAIIAAANEMDNRISQSIKRLLTSNDLPQQDNYPLDSDICDIIDGETHFQQLEKRVLLWPDTDTSSERFYEVFSGMRKKVEPLLGYFTDHSTEEVAAKCHAEIATAIIPLNVETTKAALLKQREDVQKNLAMLYIYDTLLARRKDEQGRALIKGTVIFAEHALTNAKARIAADALCDKLLELEQVEISALGCFDDVMAHIGECHSLLTQAKIHVDNGTGQFNALQLMNRKEYWDALHSAYQQVDKSNIPLEELQQAEVSWSAIEQVFTAFIKVDDVTNVVENSPPPNDRVVLSVENKTETAYALALQKLEKWGCVYIHIPEISNPLSKLIKQIRTCKKTAKVSTAELTQILTHTNAMFAGEKTPKIYQDYAKTVQGKPSTAMKMLGGFMLALGAAVACTLVLTGVGAVAAMIAAGIGMAASIGFFAASRATGLSEAMSKVAAAEAHRLK